MIIVSKVCSTRKRIHRYTTTFIIQFYGTMPDTRCVNDLPLLFFVVQNEKKKKHEKEQNKKVF